MSDYVIVTDSTIDLTAEYAEINKLVVVPLKYIIDGIEKSNYLDEREMSLKDFYKYLRAGNDVKTSQVNPEEFIETFTEILNRGEDILGIAFSSALSGTANSMFLAANELKSKYPNQKIMIIDSLCASSGEGLFVHYAVQYKMQGLSIEENFEELTNIKQKINHWFTVDDIDLLHRGGRISATQAFAAKALQIKPVLRVNSEGKLLSVYKKMGRKMALNTLVSLTIENIDNNCLQTIIISHGDCISDAEYVANKIKENISVESIVFNVIGPVIGAHSGPGTVAVFFVGKPRYI